MESPAMASPWSRLRARARRMVRRLRSEGGQSFVEYGVIVMVIGIAMILIVTVVGHQANNMYSNISNTFGNP